MENKDCNVCGGAGWVWRHELPDTSDWDGQPDDTQYTCPYCRDPYGLNEEPEDEDSEDEVVEQKIVLDEVSSSGYAQGESWMHFETIWNEAESVAKSYSDLDRKKIIRGIRNSLEDLADGESHDELHKAMGEILFGVCAFCAHLEEKGGIQINSATALQQAIESNRQKLLDPEPPE
jgi:hypothetical protein